MNVWGPAPMHFEGGAWARSEASQNHNYACQSLFLGPPCVEFLQGLHWLL